MLGQQVLHTVDTETFTLSAGKEQVVATTLRLSKPGFQYSECGLGKRCGAAMLAAILAGARPARGTCPVATVAISGGETGDQFTGSPEVKAPVGRAEMLGRIRQGGKQLDRS